jgi:CTP-dependent riboflavin kinase
MASKRDKKSDIQAPPVSWLDQLAQELNVPYAPEGWHPICVIAEKLELDHQSVRRILKKRNAQSRVFRFATKQGKIIKTPHYKL